MSRPVPSSASQLRLALDGVTPVPPSLPALPLVAEWQDQPRTWPHALHATCTYLGSLPPTLAHDLIARWSRPGDVVLDPFAGRGGVPLQACLERRIGVGIDRNPLAAVLTGAAIDPPSTRELADRLTHLRIDWTHARPGWVADANAMAEGSPAPFFHPSTLAQLMFLRRALDRFDPVDRALLAALAGILHGRRSSALTNAMPNTFSMAPAYASRWMAQRGLIPPERDVFDLLARRLAYVRREGLAPVRGIAIEADAREAGHVAEERLRLGGRPDRIRLVVTSPPYLGLVRYGSANWLRLWLLGEDPSRVDGLLDTPRSLEASAVLLRAVLDDLRPHLAEDAVLVLVLGSVTSVGGRRTRRPLDLAGAAWEAAAEPAGYRLAGVAVDRVAAMRKLTRLWGTRAGDATRSDTLLIISPTEVGRRRAISGATMPTDWTRTMGAIGPAPRLRDAAPPAPGPRPLLPDRGPRPGPLAADPGGGPSAMLGAHAADVPPG